MPMIHVRVTDTEYAELRRAATERDRTLSDYVRDALAITRTGDIHDRLERLEKAAAKEKR